MERRGWAWVVREAWCDGRLGFAVFGRHGGVHKGKTQNCQLRARRKPWPGCRRMTSCGSVSRGGSDLHGAEVPSVRGAIHRGPWGAVACRALYSAVRQGPLALRPLWPLWPRVAVAVTRCHDHDRRHPESAEPFPSLPSTPLPCPALSCPQTSPPSSSTTAHSWSTSTPKPRTPSNQQFLYVWGPARSMLSLPPFMLMGPGAGAVAVPTATFVPTHRHPGPVPAPASTRRQCRSLQQNFRQAF